MTTGAALGALRSFCRLNELTRRQHGLPPQPFRFFRALHRHILSRGFGFVSAATREGRTVAAAVFLVFGSAAVFKYAASDPHRRDLRGGNLAMWRGIAACRRHGATQLSLGKTRPANQGLLRYKRGWGGEEVRRSYVRLDGADGQPLAWEDPVEGWHNHLFRTMPVPVSRLAGRLLYRHVG